MSTNQRPRLLLSAFLMNTPSHILGGQWRHPEAQQHRYNELGLWVDLARQLEDAKFDALFFADVVGLYGIHEGGWASLVEKGLQVPSNDPLVLASALAATTSEIGLA
ncbi:MAG: LLM class flavin-dependent oxidoreductase, partial [Micrococcaceae bacterium]|nr:LLM class flavin-dependent oxidoreductase [Micrococcaceae bacterium]